MVHLKMAALACAGSMCLSGGAFAQGLITQQGVITQKVLSLDLATKLAEAALAQCKANGFNVAVAVVDREGLLQVFLRGDDTAPHNAELAQRKAYTARTFRRTSADWAKRTEPPAELGPQRNLSKVIALSGGVPINVGNETIGGLGVSGSIGLGKDESCAVAAMKKYADQLK